MQISHVDRKSTGMFSDISNRLSYNQHSLLNYITQPFSQEAFASQIKLKKEEFSDKKRKVLVEALEFKYAKIQTTAKVRENIDALSSSTTFTITTGHQLSIFTGPIYFIYKILHAIRLAEELSNSYPDSTFVPVFWMASEDHDFEEVQSISIFNKTVKWETDQRGAVGRFKLDEFHPIVEEFKSFFENHPESEVLDLLNSYTGENFGEATFNLINKLFQRFGLVVIDGDEPLLKNEFSSIIEKELTTQFSFNAVNSLSSELIKEGIKLQINPREYNLFYLENNFRARIQERSDGYYIEGKGVFTQDEMLTILKKNPSSFSPNVVLRPLYQETILPNVCYLGGGGEMAYWLQLKSVFDQVNCVFPLIQVRNSFLMIDTLQSKKMDKLGLSLENIFVDTEDLKKQYILKNSHETLNFTELDNSITHLSQIILAQVSLVDSNLKSFAQAEIIRIEKQIMTIKQKLMKIEKGKHEQDLSQIEQVKNRLFPNGGLQERSINFFSLCSDGKIQRHLDEIYSSISPFDNDLIVLS